MVQAENYENRPVFYRHDQANIQSQQSNNTLEQTCIK